MSGADQPLVTVVVPVFNGERYLRSSLDSILAQTYPALDVLVVDDASTDGTPAIIASYGDRIRSFRQPQNRGIYGNMNDGIERAKGSLIAIYHADDLYEPEIVAREVEFLQRNPEAGAVFASDIFITPDDSVRGKLVLPPEVLGDGPFDYPTILNTLLTYKNRILRCPSCMVRASVYKELGSYRPEKFLNTSDLEMYLRISRAYPLGILEEHLFRYRWGHGNSGQKYKKLRTETERFFAIMDIFLADGGRALATEPALRAYEAHRAEDSLMRAISLYILGRLAEAREVLKLAKASTILASPRVQRYRLVVVLWAMRVLVRIPRVPAIADIFRHRWHA
jgi:glycosyltransferase involved in cell wall biosynthesis